MRLYYTAPELLVFLYHDNQYWYEYIGGRDDFYEPHPWQRAENDDDIDLILTPPSVYSLASPLTFLVLTGQDFFKSLQDAGLEST